MPRLLCIGHAPLPHEPNRFQGSGNLRTWHLVKPLLDEGHEVRLVAARSPGNGEGDEASVTESREGRLHYFSVDQARFEDPAYLQQHHDAFEPDAIVGINNYPASRAVRLDTDRPTWCDLNGWAMAEAQTKAGVYDDDVFLSHFWNMEKSILDRADVLSAVSRAQADALVGELAARGRLSRRNLGWDFCHVIPNALIDRDYPPTPDPLRGPVVPEDAFVLLWSGGYNTWADVDLLVEALGRAMAELDDLHFVSTGGALHGHDDHTFGHFRGELEIAGLADRCHFTGWLPTEAVPAHYRAADLGLNVDRHCCETRFGARNRINDMLKAGLPVLTTLGTEISLELAEHDLVLGCEMGDAEAFARRIAWAHGHREELRAMGEKASTFAHEHYSYARTARPLLEWAREPRRAPDHGECVSLDSQVDFFRGGGQGMGVDPWSETAESPEERCRRLEQRLETITGSKFWRLWMLWVRLRRWLSPG